MSWPGERVRHAIAQKIRWARLTGLPIFDYEIKNPKEKKYERKDYDMKLVKMTPDEFLSMQRKMNPHLTGDLKRSHYSDDWHLMTDPFPEKRTRLKSLIKKGIAIPTPVIEFDATGSMIKFQEGYHRGLIAKELRVKRMPVWIAKRRR